MDRFSKIYSTRANAKRAARATCRKLLHAPTYEATEGPDFGLHPQRLMNGPHRFELRGPAAVMKDRAR